jgi:hypothetical protein
MASSLEDAVRADHWDVRLVKGGVAAASIGPKRPHSRESVKKPNERDWTGKRVRELDQEEAQEFSEPGEDTAEVVAAESTTLTASPARPLR